MIMRHTEPVDIFLMIAGRSYFAGIFASVYIFIANERNIILYAKMYPQHPALMQTHG